LSCCAHRLASFLPLVLYSDGCLMIIMVDLVSRRCSARVRRALHVRVPQLVGLPDSLRPPPLLFGLLSTRGFCFACCARRSIRQNQEEENSPVHVKCAITSVVLLFKA
jgi:hypothetical protein